MSKYTLVDDKEHVAMILEGLKRNKELYGKRYCPCKLQRIDENVCPCNEFVETSKCHCGLFKEE